MLGCRSQSKPARNLTGWDVGECALVLGNGSAELKDDAQRLSGLDVSCGVHAERRRPLKPTEFRVALHTMRLDGTLAPADGSLAVGGNPHVVAAGTTAVALLARFAPPLPPQPAPPGHPVALYTRVRLLIGGGGALPFNRDRATLGAVCNPSTTLGDAFGPALCDGCGLVFQVRKALGFRATGGQSNCSFVFCCACVGPAPSVCVANPTKGNE